MSSRHLSAVCRVALLVALSNVAAHAAILTPAADTESVSSPAGIALSPGTDYVYVLSGQGNGDIKIFSRNASTGTLDAVSNSPQPVDLASCDNATLKTPSSIAISPDGNFAYTTARGSNGSVGVVARFSRNPSTGKLTCQQDRMSKSLKGARGVSVSPDGRTVYVVTNSGKNQGVVAYDTTTVPGQLTLVATYLDGHNGANFLAGPTASLVAVDGKKVYVTAATDSALTTFTRTDSVGTIGTLTFSAVLRDNVAGADALQGAASLTRSPSGRTIYVAAPTDATGGNTSFPGAVGIFTRNTTTGALSFAGKVQNQTGAIGNALQGVTGVAVSPDGAYVFTAAPGSGTVALFGRDATTGALGFIEAAALSGARNVVSASITNGSCAYTTTSSSVVVHCVAGAADFGDAPDSYGTTIAAFGARHLVGTTLLGSGVSSEVDGLPAAPGADATNDGFDDGVAFDPTNILAGSSHDVTVTVGSGAISGILDAWIDYNHNGTFDSPGEQIFTNLLLGPGGNTLSFTPPLSSTGNGNTYARFRLHDAGTGGLGPTGGGGVGEVEDYQIFIFANNNIVTTTKSGNGSGRVIGSVGAVDQGIDCGDTCTSPYGTGSNVSLRAEADTGSQFTGWSGGTPACSGTGTCDFASLGQDETVDAEFTLIPYTLTVSTDTGGSVSSSPGTIDCPAVSCSQQFDYGTQVDLTATPDTGNGYIFTGWSGGGCSGLGDCLLTISADATVTAHFAKDVYHLHVDASNGTGTGTVQVNDGLTNPSCSDVCDYFYPTTGVTSITLSAVADADSSFDGWSDNGCTGSAGCAFTMNQDRAVSTGFDFSPITVTITDGSQAINGGNFPTNGQPVRVFVTMTNTSGSVAPTGNVTLKATLPSSGVTITGWICPATDVNAPPTSGASCQHGSGSGNLNESIAMAPGAQVTFQLEGVAATPAINGFVTTATADDPDLNDPPQRHTANNVGSGMTKYKVIATSGFESGLGFSTSSPP